MAASARAETLATEVQALKIIFPKAKFVDAETRALTAEQRDSLQKQSTLRFPEKDYRCFIRRGEPGDEGYAVILNEIGKHEFITFMVGVSAKGEVLDVVVLEYRENRGAEVQEPRFLRQFRGKKQGDPIQVDGDIVNYSGATLSSHAIARGVRKALALIELFYGAGAGKHP